MPRFSILTPSFGYGRFISDAIESVRNQRTTAGVEHVVMDGSSTDGTVDVLSRYDELIWKSEEDGGQSDALNKALDLASGDLIGWLNADEFYLPGALETARKVFDETGADVVYGDSIFVDVVGRLLRAVPQHKFHSGVLRHYGCYIASCAFFIKRDFLPPSPWDTNLTSIMDWDLYLNVVDAGARVQYVPKALGAFRVHEDRVTAARLPRTAPERLSVRARHGITNKPVLRGVSELYGRLQHAGRKLSEGGYKRQLEAARRKGVDQRWW